MTQRKIVEIDSERCNGCGSCITACAEGALALIDGKARLVSDVYCDGLGACIGDCPTGAITVIEREAAAFSAPPHRSGAHSNDGRAKGPAPARAPSPVMACGCPGSHETTLERVAGRDGGVASAADRPSELTHWPIKLRLLNPGAPYLAGRDLLLLADCAAAACPNLHDRLLKGRCVALACPKFDDAGSSIERLADIIREASPSSITIVYMEVPCCGGLLVMAQRAAAQSGTDVPIGSVILSRTGESIAEQSPVSGSGHALAHGTV
jgi:ferredoxin